MTPTLLLTLFLTQPTTPDLGEAPAPPTWDEELPEPIVTDEGTLLPRPLDAFVHWRLNYLDNIYPRLCQVAIDVWGEHQVAEASAAMAANNQRHREQLAGMYSSYWLAALSVGVAVVAGVVFFGIGYGAAMLNGGIL